MDNIVYNTYLLKKLHSYNMQGLWAHKYYCYLKCRLLKSKHKKNININYSEERNAHYKPGSKAYMWQ